MDPGYKILNTLEFFYKPLKKKNSSFLKYPQHKRSSRLCLIAADRDSLKDLKTQAVHSHSLDSKNSKKIQILNYTNDSDFPIEYKLNPSRKNKKDLSLGKIVINKSSRIRERNESPKKIVTSEVFSSKNCPDNDKVYWTRTRPKEDISDMNLGYSTLERSRVIEVSYFPTNNNVNIFGDLDSAPKKYIQDTITSKKNKPSKSETPFIAKTSLSDKSQEEPAPAIQDFLDRELEKKNQMKKSTKSMNFITKKTPISVNLSIEADVSQNLSSLRIQDEKESTGFTFNIFENQNIVKSEIFDTEKKTNLFSNFESEQQNNHSPFFMSEMDKKPGKSYRSIKKTKHIIQI